MATHTQDIRQPAQVSGSTVGFSIFAASMMLLSGFFQAFEGLAALFNGNFFVVGSQYAYAVDTTTWGWTHLIVGLIIAGAGLAVFSGRPWGRVIGITLAILSAVANFFFIPYYPFWALLIIAVDIAIIGALAAYGPAEAQGYE